MDQVEALLELMLGVTCHMWSLKVRIANTPFLIQTFWSYLGKMRSVTETKHEQHASVKLEREGGCHSKRNKLVDSHFMINK